MSTSVVLAEDDALRRALFAFRHRIYVDELGGERLRSTDNELYDALDTFACNYAVVGAGRVVGSLRVVDWSDLPEQAAFTERYGIERIVRDAGADTICHGGRLAVDRSMRGASCLVDLLGRAVRDRVPRGVRFVVSDCSPELFPLYAKIGYVRTGRDFVDPDFGVKWSMVWCMRDLSRMTRTGSPILSVAGAFGEDGEGGRLIAEAYRPSIAA
jgi:hypothetical protein